MNLAPSRIGSAAAEADALCDCDIDDFVDADLQGAKKEGSLGWPDRFVGAQSRFAARRTIGSVLRRRCGLCCRPANSKLQVILSFFFCLSSRRIDPPSIFDSLPTGVHLISPGSSSVARVWPPTSSLCTSQRHQRRRIDSSQQPTLGRPVPCFSSYWHVRSSAKSHDPSGRTRLSSHPRLRPIRTAHLPSRSHAHLIKALFASSDRLRIST